jgi:shikimate 5-dehydrogenase
MRPGAAVARRCGGRCVPLGRLAGERYDILVNATPVGMYGREMPVKVAAVRGSLVVDLIYRAGGTRLLREATARGIPTIGGHEILLEQGLAQFSLFTGRRPPAEVMRETVTRTLIRAAEPGE